MLGRLFILLCGLPGLQKRLWRLWYDYLARSQRSRDWTFMNYGYAGPGVDGLVLAGKDEPDRNCIQLYRHVAGAVDLSGKTVLEVGSGRGGGSSFMKRYLFPARMVGVDLSARAVDFCRSAHRIDGLEFQVADAENLPFDDGSFDAVVNVESSHCYPSFENFVSEVARVLRPGGHFLHADFREQGGAGGWRRSLEASGLDIVAETDITKHVLAALDQDNDRKLELIGKWVPRFLRRSFFDFAAVRGSAIYARFESGDLVYRSFVLRKTA